MPEVRWLEQAAQLAPLLRHARNDGTEGLGTVIDQIRPHLPQSTGRSVLLGPPEWVRSLTTCMEGLGWTTVPLHVPGLGTSLQMDRAQPKAVDWQGLFTSTQAQQEFECLVIGLQGQDYWAWESLVKVCRPTMVAVAYNPHAPLAMEATVCHGSNVFPPRDKDHGASYAALVGLARRAGYRLVHVHGPAWLVFVRTEVPLPPDLVVRTDMSAGQWSTLLDRIGYHAELGGHIPSWLEAPEPDVSQAPWEILAPEMACTPVDLEGLVLEVGAKFDATWYLQRKTFEEKASLLYRFLREERFTDFLDVGANVGMVSILARKAHPDLRVIAVEADPRLLRIIRKNFDRHGLTDAVLVNAAAGGQERGSATFSLNPGSTLDNRVQVASWRKVRVPMRRMDTLLEQVGVQGKTFIKIDTQGFELQVLSGLEKFLLGRQDWTLKMEFAPDWLKSQGTDPRAVLEHLAGRYEFAEFPERIPFGTPGLSALFANPIAPHQHDAFLAHVAAQNQGGLGWVDLIVRPRSG